MPMIRCPNCELLQYAPATDAKLPKCRGCGRLLAVARADLIAPVVSAERRLRGRRRRPRRMPRDGS